jgi:dGTPase
VEGGMKKFKDCLKHKAFDPNRSKGRKNAYPDEDEPYFNCVDPFRLCIGKILDSKARRRVDAKTQVLCDPENPHARTRARHTNEVVSSAMKIADITGLNVTLCEAIAQGHDIGHTPYGHFGEKFLSEVTGKEFRHEIFGVVIAQEIERQGHGLNLSYEVLEGMLHHSRGKNRMDIDTTLPLEYALVMFVDKINYTLSDINDAVDYGRLKKKDLPEEVFYLGKNQRERVLHCTFSLIRESAETGMISFSKSEAAEKFERIRQWMYENYYSQIDWSIQRVILERVYNFFSQNSFFEDCDPAILIALMTDKEVNSLATKVFLRGEIPRESHINNYGIMKIIPYIMGKKVDFTKPGLDW